MPCGHLPGVLGGELVLLHQLLGREVTRRELVGVDDHVDGAERHHRQQVPHRLAGALEDAADELEARLQPVGLLRRVGAPGPHLAGADVGGVVEVGPRGRSAPSAPPAGSGRPSRRTARPGRCRRCSSRSASGPCRSRTGCARSPTRAGRARTPLRAHSARDCASSSSPAYVVRPAAAFLKPLPDLIPALRLEVVRLAELVGGAAGPAGHVDLRQRVAGVVEELALLLHREGLGPDVAGVALDLEVRHLTSP